MPAKISECVMPAMDAGFHQAGRRGRRGARQAGHRRHGEKKGSAHISPYRALEWLLFVIDVYHSNIKGRFR
jgi:hypothetical protein